DGNANASLVLGIVSLIFTFVPIWGFIPIITAVIGLVLGLSAKKSIKENPNEVTGMGMATAGIILCTFVIVIFILGLMGCVLFSATNVKMIK
ncbi:MAG: DUF4190 domain-containing protein, partial [Clostridiales bacterium]|nr:DUF4190 domain-containing protein [Clostridiales bacterium]